MKKKNEKKVKNKSFPQRSPATQGEPGKGEKQKISDVLWLCLKDPKHCQPREVWRDDWSLFPGQFGKSYSEANRKQQIMQTLDSTYLWNTICEHDKNEIRIQFCNQSSGLKILNLITYQLQTWKLSTWFKKIEEKRNTWIYFIG